jgi:predicted transcriptional regulator
MCSMTELLERAIEQIRKLPVQDQDALASALLSVAGESSALIAIDDDTRAAVEDGLAQARRGDFVTDEEVAKADKRRGL